MLGFIPRARVFPLRTVLFCLSVFSITVFGKLPSVHLDGSIFFLHTSADTQISDVTLCSIESAARHHPSKRVIIYSNTWSEGLFRELPGNVYVTPLDVLAIFENYPAYTQWYKSRVWMLGFSINNLANALRLVVLHAKGGYYLDTDILVLRSLVGVHNNSIGVESIVNDSVVINSAILAKFEKSSEYMEFLLPQFLQDFEPRVWGHNGPKLLSRTINLDTPVNVIATEAFYPIHWSMIHVLFEPASEHRQLFNILSKHSFSVHLWHSLIASQVKYLEPDSVLETVMRAVCPISHAFMISPATGGGSQVVAGPHGRTYTVKIVSPTIGSLHNTMPQIKVSVKFENAHQERGFLKEKSRGNIDLCYSIKPHKASAAGTTCRNVGNFAESPGGVFSLDMKHSADTTNAQYVASVWLVHRMSRNQTSVATTTFNVRFREAKEAQQAQQLKKLMPFLMHTRTTDIGSDETQSQLFRVIVLSQKYKIGEEVDMPTYNFIQRGLLPALRNHGYKGDGDRLRMWIWGPGHTAWDTGKTLKQNLLRRFGELKNIDLVLYLPPPWPDDYVKDETSDAIPPSELREVSMDAHIGFRQAELVPNYAVTDKRANLINATYLFATYQNDIHSFINRRTSWWQASPTSRLIVHAPHAASEEIFSCHGLVDDTTRDIDILLAGAMDPVVYPLRTRLLTLAAQRRLPGKVVVLPHPGYSINSLSDANRQLLNYVNHLKRAKINLVTASVYDYAVAKYVESQLSGALIVGNVPESRKVYYSKFMVGISMDDTDDRIVSVLTEWIQNRERRLKMTTIGYTLGLRQTWTGWVHDMVNSIRVARSIEKHQNGNLVVSRLDQEGFPPKFFRSVLPHVIVDEADNAIEFHALPPFTSRRIPVRIENCAHRDRVSNIFLASSHQFIVPHSSSLTGYLKQEISHVFFCNQFPLQMDGVDILSDDYKGRAMNAFPGAFQALRSLSDNSQTCSSPKRTLSLIVLVTSVSPLRTWIYRSNLDFAADKSAWQQIVRAVGRKTKKLQTMLQSPTCKKCYQVFNISVELETDGEINVVDSRPSPLLEALPDDLVGRLFDTVWKMKGVHPHSLLPSIEALQLWLNNHNKCILIDCMDVARMELLREMLTELYFRGDFSMAWPAEISPATEPTDFLEFNHSQTNAYAHFFHTLANGGSSALHLELFGRVNTGLT